MAKKVDFVLQFGKEATDIKMLVIEGRNCINAVRPTGSRWICHLPEMEIGQEDREDDIDIFAVVAGLPHTRCDVEAVLDGNATAFRGNQFDKRGRFILNVAIPAGGQK